jgi:outer membrane protein
MWQKIVLLILLSSGIPAFLIGQQAQESIPCNLLVLSELTLGKNPTIQRQKLQIERSKANLQSASSVFDYRLNSGLSYDRNRFNLFELDPRYALVDSRINTNNYAFGGGLQRTFRSGLTANAGLEYTRISDNLPINSFNEEVGPFLSDNFTTTTFSLSQPLMRGSGRKFATANERAAGVEVESNVMNMIFVASGELLSTISGYWQYLYAHQSVAIFEENEQRVARVLEVTNDLVEAEKKPGGDLLQIQADLADKERQTLVSRQQLYSARQNLGRFIGLSESQSETLGAPLNAFPTLEQSKYAADLSLAQLIELAHANRADLKSLVKTRDALDITLDLARNSLKPQLDLGGFVSYGGRDAGNGLNRLITPLGQTQGRNVQFGFSLNYLFPLNNNLAQAGFVANQVAVSDQQVILDNQIRNIELNVSIALNNLHNSVLTLEKAGQALGFYQEVFNNEQLKFQNGLTTLLNLILFQERLTFAQLDYLQGQQQFAQAILNLRYETGTLLPPTSALAFPEDLRVFYELPDRN